MSEERTDLARFRDRKVHLFRETRSDGGAISYCGLSERAEIWREPDPDEGATCGFCLRKLAERMNDLAAAGGRRC